MSSFTLCLLFCIVCFINSEEKFSLDKVIEIGLKNDTGIRIAEDELVKKQNKLSEIKTRIFPKIDFGLGFSHVSDPTLVSTLSGNETYFTKLSLNQPIYTWGRNSYIKEVAELDIQDRIEEIKEIRLQLKYDLAKAFYDYILALEFKKVAEDNVKRLKSHLDTTKVLLNSGVLTQYDCLRAEAELSKANVNLVKSKTEVENSKDILKKKMILPLNKEIDIEGELKYEEVNYSLDECIFKALETRVELKKNKIEEKITMANKNLISSELNPNISLTGSFTLQDNRTKVTLFPDNWIGYWGAGIFFNVPISEWWKTDYAIKQEDAKLTQIKSKKRKLELDIEIDVRVAIRKIKEIENILGYQKKVIEMSEESLRLARVRFEHGLITNWEVIDVEASLTSAKMDYLKLIYEHTISILDLKKAMTEDI